jgi:hypothetical protein
MVGQRQDRTRQSAGVEGEGDQRRYVSPSFFDLFMLNYECMVDWAVQYTVGENRQMRNGYNLLGKEVLAARMSHLHTSIGR